MTNLPIFETMPGPLPPPIDQVTAHLCLRYDPLVSAPVSSRVDPDFAPSQAQRVASGGRAAAWFIQIESLEGVLRHFRRGGLLARLVRERYVWTGLARTRSFAEFDLLRRMWQAGLPVPRPLAAAVWRTGFTYRAALLTMRIPDAQPLARCLEPAVWFRAGQAIAQMHRFEVWHADLNVFNILVDRQNKVWIIDFDRGRSGSLTLAQCAENLSRLLRSVRKIVPEVEATCWVSLKEGYQTFANNI